MKIQVKNEVSSVAIGAIYAEGCTVEPSSEALLTKLQEAITRAQQRANSEALRGEVRDILRFGTYKPTGRGKPASEYLFNAARENADNFPKINNIVDINNLVSLDSLFPISVIDVVRANSSQFSIRRGKVGESYIFNPTGQTIELRDLLLVSILPQDEPCANAVKDSMKTKLQADSKDVLAILYAPLSQKQSLQTATKQFAALLQEFAKPSLIEDAIL
jgi:DNA/RNA-binding domain of Phe-tRNA-synthetase-like protein